VEAIQYSRFDGTGWSPEQTIFEAAGVTWDYVQETGIVLDHDGRPHLTFIASDGGSERFVHLWQDARGWHTSEKASRPFAVYVDAAIAEDRAIVVAYVTPDTTVERDGNSVFVRRLHGPEYSMWEVPAHSGLTGHLF
jgi:hypothetical protein